MTPMTLSEVAALLNCPVPAGAADHPVTGVATLSQATDTELSFIGSDAYLKQLAGCKAAGIVAQKRVTLPKGLQAPVFVVDDADLAIARVLARFAPPVPRPAPGIDPSARVAPSAKIAPGAAIGFNVFVGERTTIGAGTVLHPGVYVGDDVVIGDGCEVYPNAVLRERITLGNRVIINAGSVLGTDGFGYRWDGTRHTKIPQIGVIVIGDDVEIGSCTCVDRAKFGVTRIGRGSKIDNLVQLAHNVEIGDHCLIAGQAGLAGSTRVGNGVILGGQVAVRDHITIGDGAMAAATSGIAEDVPPKTVVSGTPALPHRQSLREQAALRDLPDLRVRLRKLQEEVEAMKKLVEGK